MAKVDQRAEIFTVAKVDTRGKTKHNMQPDDMAEHRKGETKIGLYVAGRVELDATKTFRLGSTE